jgi:hypothetical protein
MPAFHAADQRARVPAVTGPPGAALWSGLWSTGDHHTLDELRAALEQRQREEDADA